LARTAVVIGASSGIGAAVAAELARRGYSVGIAARRMESLHHVAAQHPGITATIRLDLHDVAESRAAAGDLIAKVGGADLFVISAGTGSGNPALDWEPEADTIAVNVTGFAAMATVAIEHFAHRSGGHLVGISSIAAIRGHGDAAS
jgi:short-subunit dehydrogenase